jgi:cysteine sulfinate desulfinase/cysteine desulfurase-like protein
VIAALAPGEAWKHGAIRFSLGVGTTHAEIDRALEVVTNAVADLRRAKSPA